MRILVKSFMLFVLVIGLVSCATTGSKFTEMRVERFSNDPEQQEYFFIVPHLLVQRFNPMFCSIMK